MRAAVGYGRLSRPCKTAGRVGRGYPGFDASEPPERPFLAIPDARGEPIVAHGVVLIGGIVRCAGWEVPYARNAPVSR